VNPLPFCDFELEAVDPDLFPAAVWRRLMMPRIQSSDFNLIKAGDLQGSLDLRQSLCRFNSLTIGPGMRPTLPSALANNRLLFRSHRSAASGVGS